MPPMDYWLTYLNSIKNWRMKLLRFPPLGRTGPNLRKSFPTLRRSLFAMYPVRRGAILPEGEQTGHYLWQSLAKPRLTSGST